MKSKKVLRYYCDHCGKGNWKKQSCLEHEEKCFHDPKNRACQTCGNKFLEFECGSWLCDHHQKELSLPGADLKGDDMYMPGNNCNYWIKADGKQT